MKTKALTISGFSILLILWLSGCGVPKPDGAAGVSFDSLKAQIPVLPGAPVDPGVPPATPPADPNSPPADPNAQVPPANPTPPPVIPPAPPAALSCYVNAYQVYCVGGNIQGGIVQMDINYIFLGNSPNFDITALSVTNDVNANIQGLLCPQPHCNGYYPHSSCIHATVHQKGTAQTWNVTSCGDAVDEIKDIFEEL